MIKAVNNINFKAVRIPKSAKLSESQERVLEDIKTKLGAKEEKKTFFIRPIGSDTLELDEVYGVKKGDTGNDEKTGYIDSLYIGRYSEDRPFELNALKKARKRRIKDFLASFVLVSSLATAIFAGLYFVSIKRLLRSLQKEKVVTVTKDNLKTVKDSIINVEKDAWKMFK